MTRTTIGTFRSTSVPSIAAALLAAMVSLPAAFAAEPNEGTANSAQDSASEKTIPKVVADLQRDKAVAGAEATSAKADKSKAEAKAEEAKLDLDALKSGRLMQFGLTGGVAAAFQIGLGTTGTSQKTAAVTPMPYVLAVPAYWGYPQASRAYCAASFGAGDEATATAAAQGIARKSAERQYIAALAALKAQRQVDAADVKAGAPPTAEQVKKSRYVIASTYLRVASDTDLEPGAVTDALNSRVAIVELSIDDETLRADAISVIADRIWNPALSGSCWGTKFGFWVGLPVGYAATTGLAEIGKTTASEAKRDISPKVAFGLALVPNAYFSVLVGVTVATITQKDVAATAGAEAIAGVEKPFWAGTIAVGGNLDVLSVLTK